jgi:AcrR family transcriptional regulator
MPPIIVPFTPPQRQRRKEARPQELLDAGLALFVEKGFAATRAEEIAARAGVSKGTLYLYYPSKEELLKAVIRERLGGELAAVAAEARRFEGSSTELLSQLYTRWWLRVHESPASGVFKLIITEARNHPDIAEFYRHEVIEPGQRIVGEVVQRGIERGEFRRDIDVPLAVYSLVLPMVMLCLHKHSVGACVPPETQIDAQAFIHQHVSIVTRGLRADAPPSRRAK